MYIALLRLFKMKVGIRKIFKFKSHLKRHQRKEEKLKVMYWWERGTKFAYFLRNHVFFFKNMLFLFCFFQWTFQGESWIQTQMPQGMKHLSRWLKIPFFCSFVLFWQAICFYHGVEITSLKITSQIASIWRWPVFSTSFFIYISDFLISLEASASHKWMISVHWSCYICMESHEMGNGQIYYLIIRWCVPYRIMDFGQVRMCFPDWQISSYFFFFLLECYIPV